MPRVRTSRVLGSLVSCFVLATGALPGQQDITEAQPWQFDSFAADAGLEGCSVLHCASGPDGRIWFASSAGLACYDGYDWTRFTTEHGLPSDYVRCVAFTSSGHCWVGTDRGATRFDTQRGIALPTVTELAGPSVRRITTDPHTDAVWFCCDQWPEPDVSSGLTRYANGRWRTWTVRDGLPSDYVQTMLIDTRGRHFVGTKRGLVELRDEVPHVLLQGEDEPGSVVWSLAEDANGAIVVGMGHRFSRLVNSQWKRLPLVSAELRPLVLATRDGTLTVASLERRIFRLYEDAAVPLSATWGARSNGIEFAMEARDGAIWLAGHNELLRWRRGGEWRLYADCPSPVLTDATGAVWLVDRRGTFVFADERWHDAGPVTRSLCLGPDGAVFGIREGRVLRWTGHGAAPQPVDIEIAQATRIDRLADGLAIIGRDAAGTDALVLVAVDKTRRVDLPPDFESTSVMTAAGATDGPLWVLAHAGGAARRLFRRVADGLEELTVPPTLLHPSSARLIVDGHGSPWLYGLFGILERRDSGWERMDSLQGRHVSDANWVGDSLGLTTRSTAGGVGGVSLTRIENGVRVWQTVDVRGEVVLGNDAKGRLLLSDDRTVTRVDARGETRTLRLPQAMDLRLAIPGPGDELWFNGAEPGRVLRYVPDGLVPRARLVWLDSAINEDDRLVLDIEVHEYKRPWASSRDARVTVEIDGAATQTFVASERPFFLSGLGRGNHRVSARVEDDSGTVSSNTVGGDVTVSAVPFQEQPWFWASTVVAMLSMLALAGYSFLVSRRLAAQTRSLAETVEQRTRDLRARDETLLHVKKMEAVGRLAGGVAHDFNNLLTVVLGNIELVRRALSSEADAETIRTLDEVEDASRRAGALTRQLLAFSRQENVEPADLDLVENVRGIAGLVRRMIPGHVDLRLDLPSEPVIVHCGRTEIEQVLTNLVLNAADAMPDGGPVTVTVRADRAACPGEDAASRRACLEVRDVGVGMTDEVKSRAFDPYFTTKPHGRGTGLGLSIVHGVLKRISGCVELESSPGVGTSVRAFFPMVGALTSPAVTAPTTSPRGDGRTLLLCEDEPALLQLSIRILEDAGYHVLASSTVQGALDHEARHDGPIDVVVTDVVTKDRSGVELAKELESRRRGVPILFISGFADQVLATYQLDPDTIHLLHKPFGPDALLAAVAETLAPTTPS